MPATDLCHPTLDRPLSIEEYKRIQEFPDNWKLSGNLIQQYKQIGNAVPVSLGAAIGKLIADDIYGNKIIQLKDFKYSRYLKTSDMDWQISLNQKSFNF
jgi:DNA (cytosine-5)-methyltransferase 1